jgi:hypothetical protein
MSSDESFQPGFNRFQKASLAVGAAALALCAAGAYSSPTQFFRSYLVAFVLWAWHWDVGRF